MITDTIKSIISAFNIMLTFGNAEVKQVKEKVDDLIRDLSLSLRSAHYITDKIVRLNERLPGLSDSEFVGEFASLHKDYEAFLNDPRKVSDSRTHCGRVTELLDEIKVSLAFYYRTNMDDWGEWVKVRETLRGITDDDNKIIDDYEATFRSLQPAFALVEGLLNAGDIGLVARARSEFGNMAQKLAADYKVLRDGMARMNEAKKHIDKF
jgi:hypothetical protein